MQRGGTVQQRDCLGWLEWEVPMNHVMMALRLDGKPWGQKGIVK